MTQHNSERTPTRPTRPQPLPRSPYRVNIHHLAKRIAKSGFSWTEDGRDVLRLMDMLGAHSIAHLDPSADYDGFTIIRDQLRGDIHFLASLYKWDHPYQDAREERNMLDAFLSLWLRKNGVAQKFAQEHLPSRPVESGSERR